MAATGEGTNGWIPHTYGIIERYIPASSSRCAPRNQQRWQLDFTAINRLHVPVALVSMLLLAAIFAWRCGGAGSTISPAGGDRQLRRARQRLYLRRHLRPA